VYNSFIIFIYLFLGLARIYFYITGYSRGGGGGGKTFSVPRQEMKTDSSYYLFIFAVLGFELRAYTLSHSASPFLRRVFSR
jgi:hypothetical protein